MMVVMMGQVSWAQSASNCGQGKGGAAIIPLDSGGSALVVVALPPLSSRAIDRRRRVYVSRNGRGAGTELVHFVVRDRIRYLDGPGESGLD